MTRWGVLLLAVYLGLGVSRMGAHKAARLSVWLTAAVIAFVTVRIVG